MICDKKAMQIMGKITRKRYRCTICKKEHTTDTNHYGEIYPFCPTCGKITVHECLELLPEGWGRPEPWKLVKIADIAEIVNHEGLRIRGIGEVAS